METIYNKVEKLASTFKEFVNTSVQSAKLQASEKVADVMANMLAVAIVAMIFLFCVCFAGVALSFVLGNVFGQIWVGFLLVSLLFLLFGIIIWKARKRLIYLPILNALIKQLFKQHHEED